MTAIVAGLIGLSVVAWQRTRARTTSRARRVVVRVVVVAVPVLGLISAVADHTANNASISAANSLTADGTPRWLHPELTTVPWWLRVPWSLLGNGHGRIGLFLGIVVACLLVDAARLTSRPGANLLVRPTPGCVTDVGARTSNVLARVPDRVAVAVNHVLRGAAGLIWMSGRDLSEQVIAHARVGDEPRREALARGAATASAQRAVREVTYDTLAAPIHVSALRLAGIATAALLLLGALVLAPATAVGIGYRLFEGLDKAHGIATFTRNPEQATLDYFLTATPGQYLADTLGVVLTFAPGNFAGAAAGRGLRPALTEFLHNPGGFLARRRTALRSDAGQIPAAGRSARESPPRSVASRVGARSADTTVDRAALHSGARYGPGWRRVDDGPTDPDYALPRPDHAAQVPTWAKPPPMLSQRCSAPA